MGIIYWILAVCRFAFVLDKKKRKEKTRFVRFEEKENELKKGESRKLITKKKKVIR